VDFDKDFGKEAFLTVSGQLNGETYACALSKIYTFGPTFRAENSNTSRHLAEFWMLEPEVAFANLDDVAGLAEAMLKYVFKAVLEERPDDMKFFAERVDSDAVARLERFVSADFAQVDYTDAVAILENAVRSSRTRFTGALTWRLSTNAIWPRNISKRRLSLKTTRKTLRPSICALTKTVKPLQRWTSWRRASVKSSVVLSVKSVWMCWTRVWKRWVLIKTTGGIAICVVTAPYRTQVSAWASSV
jgi:lysyl-tRNA synthetase class II